jgi:predicted nucleotidyltransferase
LFGTYATDEASENSDLDFLVIKDNVTDCDEAVVDLGLALLPLVVSKDILFVSTDDVKEWGT